MIAMYLEELTGVMSDDTSWTRDCTLELFTSDGGRTFFYELNGGAELDESQMQTIRQTLRDTGIQEAEPDVQGMWEKVLRDRGVETNTAEITDWKDIKQ